MNLTEVAGTPWRRKHDQPGSVTAVAPRIVYPTSLAELIELCRDHDLDERLHAAGSHWALSTAAVSDHTFVETRDPDHAHPGLSATLRTVLPGCLNPNYRAWMVSRAADGTSPPKYPYHVEAGKRLYECYAELDFGDGWDPASLATDLRVATHGAYDQSWGLATLGNSGGQTVAGALSTGTHGGDFDRPPFADSIRAMHLVLDGGRHLWLERPPTWTDEPELTDDDKLVAAYGGQELGGPDNFEVVRDSRTFDAALVSVGRLGILYSLVLEAVPQYLLRERRELTSWVAVRSQIPDRLSPLYQADGGTGEPQRFLQVAMALSGTDDPADNLVGVTRRWTAALGPDAPAPGRAERRGDPTTPPQTGQPILFSAAGRALPYEPDPNHPGQAGPHSFLLRAGMDPNVLHGAVRAAVGDIERALGLHGDADQHEWPADDRASDPSDARSMLGHVQRLTSWHGEAYRIGELFDRLRSLLLDHDDPTLRRMGAWMWGVIARAVFRGQQASDDYEAVSYAVLDQADYVDESLSVNVASTEAFFDADSPALPAFIEALVAFEREQETRGKAFVGYVSLRFTGATRALLGPQLFQHTCAVEVSGLADVDGSVALVDHAERLALEAGGAALLHWGQQNGADAAAVAAAFAAAGATHRLDAWRAVLSELTEEGRRDGFSNEFSRVKGLEVGPLLPSADRGQQAALLADGVTW